MRSSISLASPSHISPLHLGRSPQPNLLPFSNRTSLSFPHRKLTFSSPVSASSTLASASTPPRSGPDSPQRFDLFSGTRGNSYPRKKILTPLNFFKLKFSQPSLPDIVQAGDPVLHEFASELSISEINTEETQKIIDDMVRVMRSVPGVGLAAPQIGVPLQIIVLEDTIEYMSYCPKDEVLAQERKAFDLLVIVNPKLQKIGEKRARFFEGCLSVSGYRALVERHLEVKVSGFDRNGNPIDIHATGWQARILQHECDHLNGRLYVDCMVEKSFRNIDNLRLPLPSTCPKPGIC